MMKRPDVNLVLDEALRKLQAGVPFDQVLLECGEYAAELAPLLEAARRLSQPVQPTAPHGAMARSRARFLQAAEARNAQPAPFFASFRRAAVNLAIALLAVAGALLFTGLGSASALPGQALYPVKRAVERAQLALVSDSADRLLLEERFDQRRVVETLRLAGQGRSQQVSFAGFLSAAGQPWTVGGVPLELDESQLALARNLAGSYVEVEGQVRPEGGVLVSVLQLRFFELEGELTQREGQQWLVSGVWVRIDPQMHVEQPPALGQRVKITAIRLSQQDYLALSMRLEKKPEKKETELIATDSDDDDDDEDPAETPEEEFSDGESDDDDEQERIGTPAPHEDDDAEEDGDAEDNEDIEESLTPGED